MTQIQSISREKLYTDLGYRFQYLCDFVDFGQADIDAIHAAAPIVAPLVDTIVDAVYVKLFSFDITKAVFMQRNEGFKGALPGKLNSLTVGHEQIKMRKTMLNKYLVKLVTAKYDEQFIKYLDWVGRIHVSTPEKKSRINVEYIHVNALFGYVTSIVFGAVLDAKLPADTTRAVLLAFNKLLWIQNDLFARYYVLDGQEFGAGALGVKKTNSSYISWLKSLAAIPMAAAASAVAGAFFFKLYSGA